MDIKIQNLKKIYNGNTVLDIDNLGVAKGELIGLVGNNGAGKTTLLRLILDLIQADDGFVESNGQKVNESETWKEYTGSYIDGRFLIDFLTPEEYFDFIADVYHIDDETLQERLAQFEGFMHDEIMGTKKYLRDFSQGNRQKIGIIGAMIINPKVLLLENAVGIAGSGFSYTSTWNLHQVHPKRRNITANPFFFAKAHQAAIIQMSLIVGNSDALAEVGDVIAYQISTRTIELEVVAIVTNGILLEHGEV